jgi:hypothetical protein
MKNYEQVLESYKNGELNFHHESLARGYVRVGKPEVSEYNGRFGKGYKAMLNNQDSTRYCRVLYFTTAQ